MTLTQEQFDADPSLVPLVLSALMPAANDDSFDWSRELDNDPAYLAWIEEQAMTEDFRHARW